MATNMDTSGWKTLPTSTDSILLEFSVGGLSRSTSRTHQNQPGDPLAIMIVRTFTRSFCTPSCWFKMRRYLCTWMLWGISPWKRPSVTRMTIGPLETVSETGAVFGRKEKKMKMEGQRAQNMELFKREFAWFQIPQIDTCRGTETVCMKGINHISHVGHAVYAYRIPFSQLVHCWMHMHRSNLLADTMVYLCLSCSMCKRKSGVHVFDIIW